MTTDDFFRLAWVVFGLAVYFIPFLIALERKHVNRKAILVLTIFLGWTFVGWVVAIVWAYTNNCETETPHEEVEAPDNVHALYFEDR